MPTKLSNHLKNLRLARHWSLQTVADMAGCSHSAIDKLERGQTKLTVEWAQQLAPLFGVHWTAFFEESPLYESERHKEALDLISRVTPDQVQLVVDLLRQITRNS